EDGIQRDRGMRYSELHLSQQRVNCHRQPPSVHGISGNFYLEAETGKAVVITGPELMRSTTILAEFSRNGAKVASITAKDKLRSQLGKDMNIAGGSVNFSSEKALPSLCLASSRIQFSVVFSENLIQLGSRIVG